MLHLSELLVRKYDAQVARRMLGTSVSSTVEYYSYFLISVFAAICLRPLLTLKWIIICTLLMTLITVIGSFTGGYVGF